VGQREFGALKASGYLGFTGARGLPVSLPPGTPGEAPLTVFARQFMSTAPVLFVIGALNGAISVGLGAFGAHALASRLDPRSLEIFETAARYQAVHAVALLVVALLVSRAPSTALAGAGWAFAAGILLFSGSLYVLALSGVRTWGAVAPFGGTALLVGWILLAIGGWRALS
jgi:uncharacterized membrane protein YgdD (TMEM256/DUF423 family)